MKLNQEILLSAFPESAEVFDLAVERTLDRIRFEATLERKKAGRLQVRRILAWGLALLLLLAGVLGVAEGIRLGVFDFLIHKEDVLDEALDLARSDTSTLQVGDTRIDITESVFDGATFRFVMALTCTNINHPISEEELWSEEGELNRQLQKDGVIALGSFDWFTIDGTEYTMTSGSGGENVVGKENGEVLIYFELKLTSTEGVEVPEGDFTVGLPVRRYQIRDLVQGVSREEAQMFLPVKRLPLDSIRDIAPEGAQAMGKGTITITEARLSPIKVYTTLRVDFDETVPVEEARRYVDAWRDYALVDAAGNEVCPPGGYVWGWGLPHGETDEERHLWMQSEFLPAAAYPDELFLAPVGFYREDGEWGADMSMAVRLR